MRRQASIGAALLLGAGVTAATALAAGKTSVTLSEFKVVVKPATVSAGNVTFSVRNTGKLEHELVVIRTKLAPGKLPLKNGRAVEKGALGELELKGGKAGKLTLKLTAGKYALICNLPGHYKAGQYAGLTVR
jgi:uncharacterized cupredoxin-like copper-binding protein